MHKKELLSKQLQGLIDKAELHDSYNTKQKHTWCSGCGNYGIVSAVTRALTLEDIQPHETILCFDVGCNSNLSDKIGAYTIHGLHGRVLPLATGIHLANTKLTTIAFGGDGGTFSEGVNHLIHAIRNNFNFTFILHNNYNYGLTIGQASATTPYGMSMAGSPDGVVAEPINTLKMVMSLEPSFVARGFSGDVESLTNLIQKSINHKGFSYIEVLQACPTFNRKMTQNWYWDNIINLSEDDTFDYTNYEEVQNRLNKIDQDQKLAVGLIYQNNDKKPYLEKVSSRKDITTELVDEVKPYSVKELLKDFV